MSSDLRWGACSEIGLVRQVNEDSKLAAPPLFAVADGMGGHASGDVASALAVEVLQAELRKSESISDAVHSANRAIYQRASKNADLTGMGTTLTAMWTDQAKAKIAHVGDSRAYLLRAGELSRLTQDHTVVNRLVQQGRLMPEDADRHPQRSYLERALGVDPEVEVDVHVLEMEAGDRILLCSDGLFGMIDDDLIRSVMEEESDPQRATERLCEEAVHAGGNDNVTAVVVDFLPASSAPAGGAGRSVSTPPAGLRTDTGPMGGGTDSGATATLTPSPPAPPIQLSSTSSTPRRSGGPLRLVVWLAAVAGVLAIGVFFARMSIQGSWYVGVDDGRVAIFNGVPGSLAGLEFSELERRSELRADDLPELYRGRLEEGMRASSLSDADEIVADLERLRIVPPEPPIDPEADPDPAEAPGDGAAGGPDPPTAAQGPPA